VHHPPVPATAFPPHSAHRRAHAPARRFRLRWAALWPLQWRVSLWGWASLTLGEIVVALGLLAAAAGAMAATWEKNSASGVPNCHVGAGWMRGCFGARGAPLPHTPCPCILESEVWPPASAASTPAGRPGLNTHHALPCSPRYPIRLPGVYASYPMVRRRGLRGLLRTQGRVPHAATQRPAPLIIPAQCVAPPVPRPLVMVTTPAMPNLARSLPPIGS
jgi:hypothetical protein